MYAFYMYQSHTRWKWSHNLSDVSTPSAESTPRSLRPYTIQLRLPLQLYQLQLIWGQVWETISSKQSRLYPLRQNKFGCHVYYVKIRPIDQIYRHGNQIRCTLPNDFHAYGVTKHPNGRRNHSKAGVGYYPPGAWTWETSHSSFF
jgi:hypothetical protein